jgi:hypothetical protein
MDERFNANTELHTDTLLRKSWTNSLTQTQFDEPCAICGTTENIEIHHIRSVKNVRVIPLCSGHHAALHNGKLLRNEVMILSKYRGKTAPPKKKN